MPATRREFLRSSLASSLAWATAGSIASLCSPRSVLAQAAATGAAPRNRRLVLVQLIGGNDGLNTVIPYRDDAYARARPRLRVSPQTALPIAGTDLAFHPALSALRDLYAAGRLAIIQGVGYPNPNRSHFESTDIWESGDPTLGNRTFGWAGRLLDQLHDRQGGLAQGIAVEDVLPLSMAAVKTPVQTIEDPAKFGLEFRDRYLDEKAAIVTSYGQLYAVTPQESDESRYVRQVSQETYTGMADVLAAVNAYQPMASYPANSDLAGQLQSMAELIIGGSPAQVYHTAQGGYDHHSDELTKHGPLLQELSGSLAAFYQDLRGHGLDEAVTVIVYSEFGRRVEENGSLGTDHGTASATFVLGGSVRGGIYGNYPSLTDLDEGDLIYNVDFRSVYATLIENWMGGDSGALLGAKFPLLGFLQGSSPSA